MHGISPSLKMLRFTRESVVGSLKSGMPGHGDSRLLCQSTTGSSRHSTLAWTSMRPNPDVTSAGRWSEHMGRTLPMLDARGHLGHALSPSLRLEYISC